jgi:hypothetical protein
MYQTIEYQLQNNVISRKMRNRGQPSLYNPSERELKYLISLDLT